MLRGLADYRILSCLASGAQGTTYLALDQRLQRRVCIKVYHLWGPLADRRAAVNEAWKLARLDGALTLRVLDVVADGADLALVMTYQPGCDLQSLLESAGPLSVGNSLAIVSDLVTGLTALRRARLVHGDLKAANVLVNLHSRAIIADYGVAVCRGERPPGFSREALSPEQSLGEVLDLRSDFFAVGLLLHRLLYGTHPFLRDGAVDLNALRRGLMQPPDPPADVDMASGEAISALLTRLLAARPDDRPQRTFELREALQAIRKTLPAPLPLADAVLRTARAKPPPDVAPRLPRRLVRLPLRRQLRAWIQRYWQAGSPGARGLLGVALAAPLVLGVLLALQPGVCIAVREPLVFGVTSDALPGIRELHRDLTGMLRRYAPEAMLLGSGPASDSFLTASERGLMDACVAQRQLLLDLRCARGRCAMAVLARTPVGEREEKITVAVTEGSAYRQQALERLVERQAAFLLR